MARPQTVGVLAGVVGAVPEPETYALMLAGLGVLGAIARRRKLHEQAKPTSA